MIRTVMAAAAALVFTAGVSLAQTARENYGYKAPSGIFGEGTAKWNMFRFMAEDAERRNALHSGGDIATGSIQGSAVNPEQVARPGETGARRRRAR